MKKLLFFVAIAATVTSTAAAQDGERIFKKFKGDVSLGYAAPLGSNSSGGVITALEPKFGVMDKLYLGFRLEVAVVGFNNDLKGLSSYIATADYYFTNNYIFRPYIGAGAGIFEIQTNPLNSDKLSTIRFGGMIRAGAEIKHFRFSVEYNIIPDTDIPFFTYDNLGMPLVGKTKLSNAYIGIKAGFCFGGSPR